MLTTVLKTLAWVSFGIGILAALVCVIYQPFDYAIVNILVNCAIFWGAWLLLLWWVTKRQKRDAPTG